VTLRRLLVAFGLFVGVCVAQPALAQIAEAMGLPLPVADLPTGTVTARIIAGDPSVAVQIDVSFVINGAARTVTTGSDGRARVDGLTAGASVVVTVAGEQGPISSQPFQVPPRGGIRLMLSTRPLGAPSAAPGAPGMGAGMAMPAPREMAGQPRADQAVAPSSIQVRLTYNDFADPLPPAIHGVFLVGYSADMKVSVTRKPTDNAGRVEFSDLDVSGGTNYFVMTQLVRGTMVDRLMSAPIPLNAVAGYKLVLSAEKRDSTVPEVDDLSRLDQLLPNIPVGSVVVGITAEHPDQGLRVELVNAATGQVLAEESTEPTQLGQSQVQGGFGRPEPSAQVPAGVLEIALYGGGNGARGPLAGVTLEASPEGGGAPLSATTSAAGVARITGVSPGRWQITATSSFGSLQSEAVELGQGGSVVRGEVTWVEGPRMRVTGFRDLAHLPDQILYVQARLGDQLYRSLPFQPVASRGTAVMVYVADRVEFSFRMMGAVDDKFLGFHGEFELQNASWIPYRDDVDGLLIKLPAHFVGAFVDDADKDVVSPEPGGGLRIRRPLGSGKYTFTAGFSLPVIDGAVNWQLDLPWGTSTSRIAIAQTAKLFIDGLPAGLVPSVMQASNGKDYYVLDRISIDRGLSMVMRVGGLPRPPVWRTWLSRIAGGIVFALIVLTVVFTLRSRKQPAQNVAARRVETLLSELVELEDKVKAEDAPAGRVGQATARRRVILEELEDLWDKRSTDG
jgi:hypothetical protein